MSLFSHNVHIQISRTFLLLWFIAIPLAPFVYANSDNDVLTTYFPFETVRGLYYFTDRGLYAQVPDPSLPYLNHKDQHGFVLIKTAGLQKPIPGSLFAEDLPPSLGLDFGNRLALSFDDVVFDDALDRTLDILAAHKIKAVFFLTAVHIGEADRSVVKQKLERMIREGHELANHSYGHPELDRGIFADGKHDLEDTLDQFRSLESLVNRILGKNYPFRFIRPPFGIRGNSGADIGARMSIPGRVDEACRVMGRQLILWHINSLDFMLAYDTRSKFYMSPNQVVEACVSRIGETKGGVVLFHANKRLPRILDAVLTRIDRQNPANERVYSYATVDELLAIKYGPDQPQFSAP